MTYRELINNYSDFDFALVFQHSICDTFFENDETGDCIRGREYDSCMDCVMSFLKSQVRGEE